MMEKIVISNKLVLIFLLSVTLIFYGNILFGDFVFDDNIFIENNSQIRSLENIADIYRSSTTAGAGLVNDNFYRPNQQFIYAILFSFFGLTPVWFHLVPILFHILNGFLIFLLFVKLGISRHSSLVAAFVFLLHPILTQAVSYISALSEPLVFTTVLLTLFGFLGRTNKSFVLGIIAFGIGLFSKESQSVAIGLVALLAIFQYKRGELNLKRAVMFISLLISLFVLYFYLRLNFLNFTGKIGFIEVENIYTESVRVRLLTFLHILPEYFKMLVFPWHLYYEKPFFTVSTITWQAGAGVLFIIAGLALSLYSIIKKDGKIFFGFGWAACAMVPFTGLVPLNAIYLEHWLYIPIGGLIFCLAYLFDKYQILERKIWFYAIVIILVLFGARIMARNVEWGKPIKFYENELRYTQTSARIFVNLGMEYSDRGDCLAAIPLYMRGIEVNDDYPQTHHNLARCLEVIGDKQGAYREYLKALELQPNFIYSSNALQSLIQRYPSLLDSANL